MKTSEKEMKKVELDLYYCPICGWEELTNELLSRKCPNCGNQVMVGAPEMSTTELYKNGIYRRS